MSNAVGTKASREEEIAFLAVEQVRGVDVWLADAGADDKMPDGCLAYPGNRGRQGLVEVTSPPAERLLAEWARTKRAGQPQTESGSIPLRLNALAQVCAGMLDTRWAHQNFEKLLDQPVNERHLFLFAQQHRDGSYFYGLSDSYEDRTGEQVDDLVLPQGISDVWFRDRASRDADDPPGATELWLARFQAASDWHRYTIRIEEQQLPAPNPSVMSRDMCLT